MKIPLHPLVIHFPIAFIYGALFFTGLQLIKPNWTCRIVGLWMLGLSSITSVLASITGQLEIKKARSSDYSSAVHEILDKHEFYGNMITWLTLLTFLVWLYLFFKYMDNKLFDKMIFIMLIILTTMVTITGYYGGTLVWEHQVGI